LDRRLRKRSDKAVVGCAVASRRFLGQARVLVESYLEQHPGGRFTLLIPDDPEGERSLDLPIEELRPADLGLESDEVHRMALSYNVKELACAMKGRLLRFLVERGDVGILLDGDVYVYDDLTPIAAIARAEGLVLTPHCTVPHLTPDRYPPMPGHAPRMRNALGPDQMMVLAGTFNTGLMAASAGAVAFLDWWNERTARYCLLEPGRGLFQEQGWAALAPTLFDCRILHEPGWNVSLFDLPVEDVTWEDGRPRVQGAPLRCFHFITFDPRSPEKLTGEEHIAGVWPAARERPGAARVCREYARRLLAAGHQEALADTSPYEWLDVGIPVDANMRAAYAEALLQHEAGRGEAPPNPFEDGDVEGFLAWLDEPAEPPREGQPPVSRYLVGLHTRLPWVFGSFKDVPGEDSERFLSWVPDAVRVGDVEVAERWIPQVDREPRLDPAFVSLQDQYRDLLGTLETYRSSRSWRMTAPLRRAAGRTRARRGGQ
jgi:hypothetical protein